MSARTHSTSRPNSLSSSWIDAEFDGPPLSKGPDNNMSASFEDLRNTFVDTQAEYLDNLDRDELHRRANHWASGQPVLNIGADSRPGNQKAAVKAITPIGYYHRARIRISGGVGEQATTHDFEVVSEDVHRIELGEAHVRQHFFVTVQVEESPKEFRKLLKELEGKDSAKFSVGVECQCFDDMIPMKSKKITSESIEVIFTPGSSFPLVKQLHLQVYASGARPKKSYAELRRVAKTRCEHLRTGKAWM